METEELVVGCAHYKRRSKFVTPCCNKNYFCRFCHDECEDHKLNRKEIKYLVCAACNSKQEVQEKCEVCHTSFGKYVCLICKLFDDEDKKQFHCEGCGLCRTGGREKFFHCQTCNLCLPVYIKNSHKCIENVSRSDCPICLEDIHTSRISSHIPNCGHLIHQPCFENLLKAGHFACPTCQTSLLNMSELWSSLDDEILTTPMPPEYSDYKVSILCRDCHERSVVAFHLVGLKCSACGSYNTCRVDDNPHRSTGRSDNCEAATDAKSSSTVINPE